MIVWCRLFDGRLWHISEHPANTWCGKPLEAEATRRPEQIEGCPPGNGWVCDRCVRAVHEVSEVALAVWRSDPRRKDDTRHDRILDNLPDTPPPPAAETPPEEPQTPAEPVPAKKAKAAPKPDPLADVLADMQAAVAAGQTMPDYAGFIRIGTATPGSDAFSVSVLPDQTNTVIDPAGEW